MAPEKSSSILQCKSANGLFIRIVNLMRSDETSFFKLKLKKQLAKYKYRVGIAFVGGIDVRSEEKFGFCLNSFYYKHPIRKVAIEQNQISRKNLDYRQDFQKLIFQMEKIYAVRVHPLLAVISAGQVTLTKVKPGLSAFKNQSNLQ